MSYRDDYVTAVRLQDAFIRKIRQLHAAGLPSPPLGGVPTDAAWADKEERELFVFKITANWIAKATTVRMRADQSAVFLDLPAAPGQDYLRWLRLPFPSVYIQPEQPIRFDGYVSDYVEEIKTEAGKALMHQYPEEHERLHTMLQYGDPLIRGMVLAEADLSHPFKSGEWSVPANAKRLLTATFLMSLPTWPLNLHSLVIAILDDNTLSIGMRGHQVTRRRMIQWVIHTVNFLSSPSVKLVWNPPPAALNKKRAARDKAPLPGWYEITYRKLVREYNPLKIATAHWHHSFRYDVRGHMKTFTRGAMEGRVIWCPPHQRGIAHELYKPKGYRQERAGA